MRKSRGEHVNALTPKVKFMLSILGLRMLAYSFNFIFVFYLIFYSSSYNLGRKIINLCNFIFFFSGSYRWRNETCVE